MAYSAQDPYAAPQQPLLAQPIYPSYQTGTRLHLGCPKRLLD